MGGRPRQAWGFLTHVDEFLQRGDLEMLDVIVECEYLDPVSRCDGSTSRHSFMCDKLLA